MPRTQLIADYLRAQARSRIDRVEKDDHGHNARTAIALIDAADYVTTLDEHAQVLVRLAVAGCFSGGRFDPGGEGERIVGDWHHDLGPADPAELLESLAEAAERGVALAPRPPQPRPAYP
ncbi:hypothetical protein SAMN04489712_103437 [Thermomonospora echinospora]|uniref:Uncharacterized protein n=1 Tax=Thermomonospora echinospora TaxID=1992 RepID=A0A1H5XVX3_9ACTN|nr:hypothetical protein [Thermomonospora echinospora]SEG15949.1 hypothetical protein SAMN04489712_103437 [Thermomonospora echinospora]